jgi:hypothetical protein
MRDASDSLGEWQMKLAAAAATFLLVLGACTRSLDPERLNAKKLAAPRVDEG